MEAVLHYWEKNKINGDVKPAYKHPNKYHSFLNIKFGMLIMVSV